MRIDDDKVKEILNSLKNCHFDELTNETSESLVFENAEGYDECYTGATKIVLNPGPLDDFVVKIPFTHSLYEGYDDDTEEPYEKTEEFSMAPFGGKWDYCRTEVNVYEMAIEDKVEQYFLPIYYIGDVKGHPIYIQEKIIVSDEYCSSSTFEDRAEVKKSCDEKLLDMFNTEWVTDFVMTYGIDAFADLDKFFGKIGLTDLHSGNVGYYHGVPVVVDYAGYYE